MSAKSYDIVTTESRDSFLQELEFQQLVGADSSANFFEIDYNFVLEVKIRDQVYFKLLVSESQVVKKQLTKENLELKEFLWYLNQLEAEILANSLKNANNWEFTDSPVSPVQRIQLDKFDPSLETIKLKPIAVSPDDSMEDEEIFSLITNKISSISDKSSNISEENYDSLTPYLIKEYEFIESSIQQLSPTKKQYFSTILQDLTANKNALAANRFTFKISPVLKEFQSSQADKTFFNDKEKVEALRVKLLGLLKDLNDLDSDIRAILVREEGLITDYYLYLIENLVLIKQQEAELSYLAQDFQRSRRLLENGSIILRYVSFDLCDSLSAEENQTKCDVDLKRLNDNNQKLITLATNASSAKLNSEISGFLVPLEKYYITRLYELRDGYLKDGKSQKDANLIAELRSNREVKGIYKTALLKVKAAQEDGLPLEGTTFNLLEKPMQNKSLLPDLAYMACETLSLHRAYCSRGFSPKFPDYDPTLRLGVGISPPIQPYYPTNGLYAKLSFQSDLSILEETFPRLSLYPVYLYTAMNVRSYKNNQYDDSGKLIEPVGLNGRLLAGDVGFGWKFGPFYSNIALRTFHYHEEVQSSNSSTSASLTGIGPVGTLGLQVSIFSTEVEYSIEPDGFGGQLGGLSYNVGVEYRL